MLKDVHRFRRRLQKINLSKNLSDSKSECKVKRQSKHLGKHQGKQEYRKEALSKLSSDIGQSVSIAQARKQNLPEITYPAELPIAQKSELIKSMIQRNQVTILCGETGSGKTTQLPKMCLDIGLGIRGKIAHTQPRRLAARAVSKRIAEELNTQPGNEVGFKVRFSDQSNDNSYIKLMTDGILLAECNHDPFLNQYDCIIIDEAHERSLNIDFLLGYLKRLINKRKDLKIIITSATIDPDRFSKHFNNAPVVNVSGRTYPVEVRYRPFLSADNETRRDLQQGIVDAVAELSTIDRGDILVFLSGERDIRETADALNKQRDKRFMDNTEVLPLLARLSNTEQNRIFHTSHKRRIILSTNVAETSLTVPGIKYVIDSGVARISRYSWRSKIQRLPIEKISQASANQRKGRCGRVSDGICIRLYEAEDFSQRDEFTEPEIKRTNLAAVILQMENLRLGHIDDFPFVEPPDERLINDGYKLLFELGAIAGDKYSAYKLTKVGKKLAALPIEPKLSRILLEANTERALTEVLIIVSALATQDPRERPLDKQQAADEKHAVFTDKLSDFIFYINLWRAYHDEKQLISGNQLRKWCKRNFISWMRMREWIDTHSQVKKMLSAQKLAFNKTHASYDQVHRSLLTGLLANIGFKNEGKEFLAARNKKIHVFPGSSLFKKPPTWIVAAEIVETSQVYARTNAKIDVAWIEDKAKHLLKFHYSNPHWEKKRSQVVAHQQSTLYGLIINPDKKVSYERVNAKEAKEIFIRSALIEGDLDSRTGNRAKFFRHNMQLIESLEAQEAKSRRRDILVDENILYEFYDQHLPDNVVGGATLEKWLRKNPGQEKALFISKQDLIRDDATLVADDQFPDTLKMNGSIFPIVYHFDPRNHCDGITLVTPVAAINAVDAQRCEWLIPGLLHEKIIALIKSLPKQLRKNFVPAPNFADACIDAFLEAGTNNSFDEPALFDQPLCVAVTQHLKKITGVQIPYDAWNMQAISQYLLMNFRVIDGKGNVIEEGRDLQVIRSHLAGDEGNMPEIVTEAEYDETINQDDVTPAVLDSLHETVEIKLHGVLIKAYPALVREGKKVNLRAVENKKKAALETKLALRQLVMITMPEQVKHLRRSIPDNRNLCLKYADFGRCDELKAEIVNKVIDDVMLFDTIGSEEEFYVRIEKGKAELHERMERISQQLSTVLDAYRGIRKLMKNPALSQLDTITDIQAQLEHLFPKQFISTIEPQWLQQYPRYLSGIHKRLEKQKTNTTRDRQLRLEFSVLWDEYVKRHESLQKQGAESESLCHYRWMLEEYRISLFAQELKTQFPISAKRLKSYWDTI
jgi:ATP-dependent helicase HrpA